jgi:hypothetical protein
MFADVCICERDRLVIREIPAKMLIYCVLEENCAGVGERGGELNREVDEVCGRVKEILTSSVDEWGNDWEN